MKVNECNFETLERVGKITGVDYDIIWRDAENIDGYIDSDAMYEMIRDLLCEIDRINESMEDMSNYYQDNWKPIPEGQLYGVIDEDFI